LISFEEVCKIADFGLSTFHSTINGYNNHTVGLGSFLFVSPEQLVDEKYNLKADIFSFGLVFLGVLVKFQDIKQLNQAIKAVREDRKLPNEYEDLFVKEGELILNMTEKDPEKRPNTSEILQFITDVISKNIKIQELESGLNTKRLFEMHENYIGIITYLKNSVTYQCEVLFQTPQFVIKKVRFQRNINEKHVNLWKFGYRNFHDLVGSLQIYLIYPGI